MIHTPRPLLGLRAAAALVVVLAALGCTSPSRSTSEATGPDQLEFEFDRINPPGHMDQTLLIANSGTSAVIPTLEITPVDRGGAVLPGVTVSTAFGTDRGKVVVPARKTTIDVLAFAGDGAANVADVRVSVQEMTTVAFPAAPQDVVVEAVDAAGQSTSKFSTFDAVALANPNSEKVSVGVVCMLWGESPDGQPQQVHEVIPVGFTSIARNGSATIRATGDAKNGCGSLKAFFSPPA
ncbi:hypothetical protein [Actinoplanes sp. NPDC026623]|uniref:hypothetical protein n=1 Tax=Actinoplanes sp. NPDC026623 TaxID=3155610 RepID=UPI0033F5BA49